ncbi:hypothetical protein TCON_1920 [Astathelohania contejeani]|uniref:Uncharacterized protein n=1 Tax=Astathelohania contejeani TaxID=164912 RepID=A0ABQ7HXG3_9MICR|nr:hypothetical protein TCON_1920 [Thelohania contejeani]
MIITGKNKNIFILKNELFLIRSTMICKYTIDGMLLEEKPSSHSKYKLFDKFYYLKNNSLFSTQTLFEEGKYEYDIPENLYDFTPRYLILSVEDGLFAAVKYENPSLNLISFPRGLYSLIDDSIYYLENDTLKFFNLITSEAKDLISHCNINKLAVSKEYIAYTDKSTRIFVYNQNNSVCHSYHWHNSRIVSLDIYDNFIFSTCKNNLLLKYDVLRDEKKMLFSFVGKFISFLCHDNCYLLLTDVAVYIYSRKLSTVENIIYTLPTPDRVCWWSGEDIVLENIDEKSVIPKKTHLKINYMDVLANPDPLHSNTLLIHKDNLIFFYDKSIYRIFKCDSNISNFFISKGKLIVIGRLYKKQFLHKYSINEEGYTLEKEIYLKGKVCDCIINSRGELIICGIDLECQEYERCENEVIKVLSIGEDEIALVKKGQIEFRNEIIKTEGLSPRLVKVFNDELYYGKDGTIFKYPDEKILDIEVKDYYLFEDKCLLVNSNGELRLRRNGMDEKIADNVNYIYGRFYYSNSKKEIIYYDYEV